MKLCVEGLEHALDIEKGSVTVLEIHNRTLFNRIARSLMSCEGEEAVEPYTLWEGMREIRPSDGFLAIESPLSLPWGHRLLEGKLYESVERLFFADDYARQNFEALGRSLFSAVAGIGFQMNAEYTFDIAWDMRRCLKAFGYVPDCSSCDSLLDSLILFTDFAADMGIDRPLLFINLKIFLSESDLEVLYQRFFFQKIPVLLIECVPDENSHENEQKLVVDPWFCEEMKSGCPSSCREEFAPTVLEQ